jgi:class 3 adenylate cyclase
MSAALPSSGAALRAALEEYADSMSSAAQLALESCGPDCGAGRELERVHECAEAVYRIVHEQLSARHFASVRTTPEEELHRIRHDLRNLLQSVLLRCELATEDTEMPETVRSDIAGIHRSARECVAALNQNRDEMATGDVMAHPIDPQDGLPAVPAAPGLAFPSRILVADDSAQSRELLTRFLSREGHTVVTAANGREAIDCVQAEEFDLILLDIQMPEMNGFEVLGELRRLGTLNCTPVILISGMDEETYAVRGIELGADDFLPRPVNLKLLRARVNSSLERQRLREQELAQYFTPRLARHLLRHPEILATGRSTEVSVLFCDIVGFSRVADRIGPDHTLQWLSAVLGAMSDCVMAEDGVLVDYTGDQIMALWGAPQDQPGHADRACRCATAMMQALPALSQKWRSVTGQETAVSIGINTGPAFVGNIGTEQKFKFGALGNVVNIASRVQGATKFMRAGVLFTGQTRARLQTSFPSRRLGSVRVNNIGTPVELHELFSAQSHETDELTAAYEAALVDCESGEIETGSCKLCSLLEEFPDDGPSLQLMSRTIGADFDPVWTLPGK